MIDWLSENLSTIIAGMILLAVLAGVVAYMIKAKRQGKSSCGCGCRCCGARQNPKDFAEAPMQGCPKSRERSE